MTLLSEYTTQQYKLVQHSRRTLFNYCETISAPDFINQNSSFGRGGSIRNLLVHVANTYQFWIGANALKKDIRFTTYDSQENINDIIILFKNIDIIMYEFIELFNNQIIDEIEYELNGITKSVSLFKLFTHVITHEFHHKGQVLSLSRHLGYIPIDTDIIN